MAKKRQLVNLLMSSVIMGMSKRRMESSSIDTRLYDNITGITYSSLNVLTAKVRSVRPWSSRFNLVSQCLTTCQTWWSYFPTLEGDIPRKWDTWGPIALLESPNLVLISFCIAAILQFIFLNKCRCSGDVTVTSWGRDMETGRFGLKAAE